MYAFLINPSFLSVFCKCQKGTSGAGMSTSVFDRVTFQISLPWMASKFLLFPKKVLSLISNTWAGSKALWVFKKANLCTEL